MRRRALAIAGALAMAILVAPATAAGHAVLVDSAPKRGATLPSQPRHVELHFSETVEANFGAVRIFDAAGKRVDAGETVHPAGTGARLAVGLQPGLADGTYVATYRVISADSHPVSGGLVFSIGAPGAAAAPTVAELIGSSDAGPSTEVAFGVARGLTYLATALLLGGPGFLLFVWLPSLRATAGTSDDWLAASAAFAGRLRLLLLGAAAVGVLAGLTGIVLQGATAAGISAWSALDPAVIGDVLGTRFGRVWGVRVLAFAALAILLAFALRAAHEPRDASPVCAGGARGAGLRRAALGAHGLRRAALGAHGLAAPGAPRALLALLAVPAAFVALAPALAGHSSVTPPTWLLVPLDVGHVAAMSAWIGGLAVLLAVLPAATRRLEGPDRTRLLAASLLRFSPIALACVGVLLFTGTNQAIEHMSAWSQLTSTGFGRAVLIKVGLLALLIAIGAINRRRVVPAMRALAADGDAPGATGHLLRRTLRAEVALVLVVLGVASALVSYPPPDTLASGPFSGASELGPLRLEATVDPARVGPNELHLYLLNARDGTPFAGTKELAVTLALPAQDIGPLRARARKAGPGHYIIDTVQLAPGGDWRLRVVDRVSEFDEYETTLTVPVQ